MSEKSMIRDLTVGNPLKQLLKFAYPFVLANLLQQIYSITDLVIVGQFIGSAGLAAASAGTDIASFFLLVCFGFSMAGQITISQHIGAGNREKICRTIGTLFTFLFILAAVFMAIALLVCDWALEAINVPPEAAEYAHDYAFTYFCGMIPVFGYNVVSSILRGMGDSKRPFYFVAIAAVLNIGLDLLFVGPFGWACFGAALATVISQTTSFVIAIIYLYRHREAFGFDFRLKSFGLDRHEMVPFFKLGLPIAIQNGAISLSMIITNSFINEYGVVAAATTAVGNKICMVTTIIASALMSASNSIVAQSFAAKKYRRVSETLFWTLIVCVVFCSVLSILMILFPEAIFSCFDTNPEVLAMARSYVPVAIISFFGFATRSAGFALINGVGYSVLGFAGGLIDGFACRVGLSLLLGITFGMGIQGFWYGHALAGHIIGVIALVLYLSGKWKTKKLLVE